MRIARVFPRRTKATPNDELSFSLVHRNGEIVNWQDALPGMFVPEIDEVHISVAFTYDLPVAELLAKQWESVGVPVKMGGPAFDEPGGEFFPGRYLKHGYVITSRGCPNRCVYADGQKCMVPKREGYKLRELPIRDGWNVLDDNLLACSDNHINAVFDMLARQPQKPEFTGGLEAKILKPRHAKRLYELKAQRMYFAYDTPDDYEPLIQAGSILQEAGFTVASHIMCCYVLIGYKDDTFDKAEKRLYDTIKAGFMPYAMLWKDKDGHEDPLWGKFQREWLRPQIVATKMRNLLGGVRLEANL